MPLKTSAQKIIILKGGLLSKAVSQVGCPFIGGLRSEWWMKSGHGGGGSKKAEIGWTSFVHGPLHTATRSPLIANTEANKF